MNACTNGKLTFFGKAKGYSICRIPQQSGQWKCWHGHHCPCFIDSHKPLPQTCADIRHAVAMQAVDTAVVMNKVSKALAPFFANAASQTPQIFDEPALTDEPIF